ncbi:unnamed protein product, partial [Staurois parvus]
FPHLGQEYRFSPCEISDVQKVLTSVKNISHTLCRSMASLPCGISDVSQELLSLGNISHTRYRRTTSSPRGSVRCLTRVALCEQHFPHTGQENDFGL